MVLERFAGADVLTFESGASVWQTRELHLGAHSMIGTIKNGF